MAMEVLWEKKALTSNSTIIIATKRVSLMVALKVVLMVEVPLAVGLHHLAVLPHRECMRRI